MKKVLKLLKKDVGIEVLDMGHEDFNLTIVGLIFLLVCMLLWVPLLFLWCIPTKVIIEFVLLMVAVVYLTARITMYEK